MTDKPSREVLRQMHAELRVMGEGDTVTIPRRLFGHLLDEVEAHWDDVFFDGTDGASDAYWRGEERGVRGAVMCIQRALDGSDDGGSNRGLEDIRRRVLHLVETCRLVTRANQVLREGCWDLAKRVSENDNMWAQMYREENRIIGHRLLRAERIIRAAGQLYEHPVIGRELTELFDALQAYRDAP